MRPIRLGIQANASQFGLLVAVNALVGATIGLERSILPALATEEFGLKAHTATLSFIAVFGVTKALTNYVAGQLADAHGRKAVLVAGWLAAVPFPFLMMWAPSWPWVLVANALLGVSQGLTWSTAVVMKVDLAGSEQRGLALGLNEFAGYVALALSAGITGVVADAFHLRPEPFWLGVGLVFGGLLLSAVFVRDTRAHLALEASASPEPLARNLSAATQAGLVNNLNDGVAWGLFPVLYASAGMDLRSIGLLAAIYPAVWGVAQLGSGALSDRVGRKGLIVGGMWVQAAGIGVVILASTFGGLLLGNVLLGLGKAMAYPVLLAAVGDVADPGRRASAIGVYRMWRDLGYAAGALIAGAVADLLGLSPAVWFVAALTFASGVVVHVRMTDARGAR